MRSLRDVSARLLTRPLARRRQQPIRLRLEELEDRATPAQVPTPGSPFFIQTNGPTTNISNGDWYTANTTQGGGNGYHYFQIEVPPGWNPANKIQVDLFSPEDNGNFASDERNGPGDTTLDPTQFEIYKPGTAYSAYAQPAPGAAGSLFAQTYAPIAAGGAATAWNRFYTIDTSVTGTGVYLLRAATLGNDQNAWSLRVGTDNDNDPNNSPPANYDNPDGLPGTNDELSIGILQASYQQDSAANQTLTLYQYVKPAQPSVTFNNFDFDGTGTVTYVRPDGTTVAGTISGSSVWNNGGTTTTRAGDTLLNPQAGWWQIQSTINPNNQFTQEGQNQQPTYFTQPPTPVIQLTKTDNITTTGPNAVLTYTVNFTNTSDVVPGTPGAANNFSLTDTLPANTTFVSAAFGTGYSGTITNPGVGNTGNVVFNFNQIINAGQTGNVTIVVQATAAASGTIVNSVDSNFTDGIGRPFVSPPATDTDTIPDINGVVYLDNNNNGVFEPPGETGIGGVTIQLFNTDTNSLVATQVTAADGTYNFRGLNPGTHYKLVETHPAGYIDGIDTAGNASGSPGVAGSDLISGIVLTGADINATGYNFGERLPPQADLQITKTDGTATYTPGTAVTYTIVAKNAGPSAVVGAVVADPFPAALTGATWTAAYSAGASGPASGSGNINATVNLADAATATFTVTGTVSSAATGNLVNTATVTPPGTITDPTPGNNTATDTDTPNPKADLQITKTDGNATYTAGGTETYTIVAKNVGPSDVTAATVADALPATLTGATWTVAYSAGASGPASGSGNINAAVNLASGATATFIVSANVLSSATGNLVNTATVAVPPGTTDPTPANNTATDTDTPAPSADLQITKTDGTATYTAGGTVTYTIVAKNAGLSDVTAATVADALPASLTGATWTVAYSAGASGPAGGAGNINASVNLASGATATFTVTANVLSSATGNLVNTATVAVPPGTTDPTPGNNTATDTDTPNPKADLQITKTDGSATYLPGGSVTYTIVAKNAGVSDVTGATVADALPASLTGATWTVAYSAGASGPAGGSGNVNATVNLAVNATATFTVTANVLPGATGNLVNTATVAVPPGVTDPTPGNNTATDTDTPAPSADLQVTKTDGSATYTAGGSVTYTIVAKNAGVSDVAGATVVDALPATLTGATWTVAYSAGASGPAGGSGNINASVNLAAGATATFTVTANVLSSSTGNLVNTATVAVPPGTTDPTPGNNTATDTDTPNPKADLQITKTDGSATYTAGGTETYTIVAKNVGPSDVTAATVADALPATLTGATWTVAYSAGASGPASGSGNINASVNLASGATATFTVTATILSSATGNLVNTATVAVPPGVTDPTPANNTATDTDTPAPSADLQITKTDGSATYLPGGSVTYTIVAKNAGVSDVTAATVADALPASLTGATWTVAYSAGASGPASGSGNINAAVNLASGSTATFTVTANVSSSATGNLVNTATVAVPPGVTDPTPANNTATDTDTPAPSADLQITKTDGSATYTAGGSVTYTIVAKNAGVSDVTGATVADALPASLTGATWTAAYSAGASGPASGSGNINASVNLAAGATATFTVTANVLSSATGNLVNTATVAVPPGTTDPTPANNTATDTDTPAPSADLQVTKTDGSATYTAGGSVTYTIVAKNAGVSDVTAATVADALPATLTGATWTVAYSAGASGPAGGSGNVNASVNLAAGATATFTVTASILSSATGNLVNTATVAVPPGVTDPTPANNTATDTDTPAPSADLQITKTDGTATYTAGGTVTYTIVAKNAGLSDVIAATVADALPASLTGATWTVAYSAGASGPASGSGNINASVNLASGATATFTVTATILSSATGNLVNTATVAVPPGVTDPTPGNNTATDTDTPNPKADLQITKTDGTASYTPGGTVTYAIVATNAGLSDVTGATVADALPASLSGATWTAAYSAGGSGPASGSGNINATVNLAAGATATFTLTANVSAGASGNLVNTATVAVPPGVTDPTPGNNTATDTDGPNVTADLQVTKTDGTATYTPGGTVTYTVVAKNAGPSGVSGATVTDALPATLTGATWTVAYSAGASGPAGGSGNVNATVNLPFNATATFTVTANVLSSATGNLVNTATVALPPGATDPTPGNNTATDTDTPTPSADLQVTKTDGSATYTAGGSVTYTIVAKNAGVSDVTAATVADALPATLTGATWTVAYSAGASGPASGSGNINASVNLAAGATATFTVTANVLSSATGNLVNTATVAVPPGTTDPTPGNNTSTDTDGPAPSADLQITKTDGSATYTAGGSVTYTIVAKNAGLSDVTAATVADALPASLTGATWTVAYSAGASGPASGSGNINATVNLASGATATFTVTANVLSSATGNLVNTATVAVPPGVTDPTPGNNTATDTDTPAPSADLQITKTDGSATYLPGGSVTYTIVAKNAGVSDVTGATVADALPASLSGATWTAAYSAGASGPASGSGNINASVNLAAGATATFTVTANVLSSATGNLVNTATVAVPPGTTDPTPANNTATDTDTPAPSADLQVTKTDGSATYTAGGSVTYTIVAKNAGVSDVTAATVADALPATLTGATWTVAYSAGASGPAGGSGNVNASVNLAAGATATFTLTASILSSATGNLVNTATVAVPPGVTDPTPANNTATDTDTPAPSADLQITKTDGTATYTAGGSVTYTIVAKNAGLSDVIAATVADALPASLTGATWTVAYSAGASGPASGSGNINASVNLASGATATFTVTANILSSATGNLVNTATVAVPPGVTDPTPANNTATDTDTPAPSADLRITKTDGTTSYTPGGTVTYTIVATNAGLSDVTGATVADALPASLSGATWTAAYSAGGSGPAGGSGNINAAVNLASGATATFTLTANVSAGASGNLVNTATVAVPPGVTDPTPGNNTATDTDGPNVTADLQVTKTDGTATYTPGGTVTYTVVAKNVGPSAVAGATVADLLPASLTGATWTVAYAGGGSGPAGGSGNVNATVNLPFNATATFTVTANVLSSATGNLVNTATVALPPGATDPTPGNNTATDTDTPAPSADLQVTKTDGSATYTAGGSVVYTIVAKNAGLSDVTGATVTDALPASLAGATWTVSYSAGASGPASGAGSINAAVNLAAGATATFTVTANILSSATGNLVNTATVAVPPGTTDPTPGNNTSTDTDGPAPSADLQITKTDGSATYTAGGSVTYTIVAKNAGLSDVTAATVADALPASLTGATWTVAYSAGASGPASGSGNVNASVNLASGATATFTVTANVLSGATGNLVNTATVAVPPGVTDPTPGNNTATDTDTPAPSADLQITKTDGSATYLPGGSVTYTIVAKNAGVSDVTGATVADALPASLTGATWTAAYSAGASGPASGSGNINASVNLAAGATATFTVTANVLSSATGNLVNTATVAVPPGTTDPTPGNNTATDTDTPAPSADLQVTKTDGSATYTAGGTVTYTIVAKNAGVSDVAGATVADALPATLTGATWTVAYSAGASGPASGSGNINASVNLAAGATATFTLTATILSSATGNLVNTATVAVPPGTTDPTPGNNTATDTDTPAPSADLQVTKTDGSATYTAGGSVTYTIVAKNAGLSDVTGATVTDALPASLIGATWTAAYSAGASGPASGSGNINASVNLAAGATATFTVSATVAANASGNLVNTATVAVPPGTTDPTPGNNTGTDTDALVEPLLQVAKTVVTADTSVDGGSTVSYKVVISHAPGSASTAYNVHLGDALAGVGLTLNPASVTVLAPAYAAVANASDLTGVDLTASQLKLGDQIVVTYSASVNGTTQAVVPAPGSTVTNTATVGYATAPSGGKSEPGLSSQAQIEVNTNSIAGEIYSDANDDGFRDNGESLIVGPSIGVTLTGKDNLGNVVNRSITTTTGTYLFAGLRASDPTGYTLTETTQPAGYLDGKDTPGTPFSGAGSTTPGVDAITNIGVPLNTPQNGTANAGTGYDFGELLPASVGDFVWNDLNGNGRQDSGEPGIDGISVTLSGTDDTGNPIVPQTATTAGGGLYSFSNLRPGTYTETFGNVAGGVSYSYTVPNAPGSTPANDSNANPVTGNASFALAAGQANNTIDAGLYQPSTLSGSVYVDVNGNGAPDLGEPGINGVAIKLTGTDVNGQSVTKNASTALDGSYSFGGLLPGTYAISETQPAGYGQGTNAVGPAGGTVGPGTDALTAIPVGPGATDAGYTFGETVSGISGVVYYDRNQNSAFDGADTGLANVTVTLRNAGGAVLATKLTGPNGSYLFPNLLAGTYTVTETQPAGYGSSEAPTNVRTEVLAAGGSATSQNFGDTLSAISGLVYTDFNLNGTYDTVDPQHPDVGIPSIGLTLLDGTGATVATTVSAADGTYSFTDLMPGNYTVVEAQPPAPTATATGFYDGATNIGSLGGTRPGANRLSLALGIDPTTQLSQVGTAYNFGEIPPADPFGYVYLDANRNGVRDPGEPGIGGVQITVSGTVAVVNPDGSTGSRPLVAADAPNGLVVTTNSLGRYDFNPLPPGVYTLTESPPAGYIQGALQNGDPSSPAPSTGVNFFTNVVLKPFPVRGPFNFAELLIPTSGPLPPIPGGPGDTSKREFLGSTPAVQTLSTDPNYADVRGANTLPPVYVAVTGAQGWVRVFDYGTGVERFRFQPYGNFSGGIRVAVADVTGDGIPDIITAPGKGGGPHIMVYDGSTGQVVASFFAFDPSFTGGVFVAAGDMNGDGHAEIVATPDAGGGPVVAVFDGKTFNQISSFYAFDPNFRGGVRVAVGDINGDGKADVVVTPGAGGGPVVEGFSGASIVAGNPTMLFNPFYAMDPNLRLGFYLSVADANGDGFGDIFVGAGEGGGPRVTSYDGKALTQTGQANVLSNFFAGDPNGSAGARIAAIDLNGKQLPTLFAVPGPGSRPYVYAYNSLTGLLEDPFFGFNVNDLNGEFVA